MWLWARARGLSSPNAHLLRVFQVPCIFIAARHQHWDPREQAPRLSDHRSRRDSQASRQCPEDARRRSSREQFEHQGNDRRDYRQESAGNESSEQGWDQVLPEDTRRRRFLERRKFARPGTSSHQRNEQSEEEQGDSEYRGWTLPGESTKRRKKSKKERKLEGWKFAPSSGFRAKAYPFEWSEMPVSQLLEETGETDIQACSWVPLPGGPTKVKNMLVDNFPHRFRTQEEKRKRHDLLMQKVAKQIELVEYDQMRNRWTRDPPDKLKKWQRAYIQEQVNKERKRRYDEIMKMKKMEEVEKRFVRRMQGLPESGDEEESLPWHSDSILRRLKKERRRKRPTRLHPPPYNSLWVKRPRNISNWWYGTGNAAKEAKEAQQVDEDEDQEVSEAEVERTEEELQARDERRIGRFQRYVEKKMPLFDDFLENGDSERKEPELNVVLNHLAKQEAERRSSQEAGTRSSPQEVIKQQDEEVIPQEVAKQEVEENALQEVVKSSFEIPPLIPGRGAVLVSSLYDILKEGDWDTQKVEALEKFKYAKILPYQVSQVLKKLENWRVALEFFNWAKTIPTFKHDSLNYSTMIRNLGRCGNYIEGKKLFDEMRASGLAPDNYTVNNLLKCYCSANRVDEAVKLYYELPDYGCQPDGCTFAILIDLFGKTGRVLEMRELFFDMQKKNFKADAYVFNSMIANFSRWKDLKLAMQAAEHMRDSGVEYSTVTYATLIHMYAKELNFYHAERLYIDYLASYLPPDIYVYNGAILYLGLAGRCREAEWAFEDIEKAGLVPDKFSYCTLISSWAREGCVRDARKWFEKARTRGITPSAEMCNALIDGYIKAMDLERIDELLTQMPRWGVKPTLQTFTYLFNYYSECAKEYVDILRGYMRKTNHPADKFLDDIFGGKVPLKQLMAFSQKFFESMRLEKSGWTAKFADAVIHYLQTYGYTEEAHAVFKAAASARLFKRNLWDNLEGNWHIWLVDMEEGTALVGLQQGLLISREMLKKSRPFMATIVTGFNKHKATRSALAVREALKELESPFRTSLDYAKLDSEGYLFAEWLLGTPIDNDIEFNHPDYVFPKDTRVCFRIMNL